MKHYGKQRRRLEALLAHLRRRTEAVNRDLRREEGPIETDFEEQVTQVENDEVLERLLEQGGGQIARVEHALARLEAGTYGACEDCGKRIAPQRLEAVPYATTCIKCAHQREAAA